MMSFHYEWANVRGARTLLMKVAKEAPHQGRIGAELSSIPEPEVDAAHKTGTNSKRMLLLIPGNPGCINYYQEFALALWRLLGGTVPVWGISHAGHVFHDELKQETFDGNAYPTLQFQVDHKRMFLDHLIPVHVEQITIIGHSIGSYIALQLAKQSKDPRINHVIGLFPTIERMALTPHGKIYTPVFRYGRWLLYGLVSAFSFLPERFQHWLLRYSVPALTVGTGHLFDGAVNLTKLPSVRCCAMMTLDEMDQVKTLDRSLIEDQTARVTLYYGQNDHWCPVSYHADITKTFPDAEIFLCNHGLEHAFVMGDVKPLAEIVAKWMTDPIKYL